MGNGYSREPSDAFEQLQMILQQARAALREIQALDGSQIYNTVQELRNLIDGLLTQVNGNFSGTLTVAGTSTLGLIDSLATYSRSVTGSGMYRVMYVNIDGEIGYVPSSRKTKQAIRTLDVAPEAIEALRLVEFRYNQAVAAMGENAPTEVGLIAEEVDAAGLTWLVDYDSEGCPQGVRYDRLSLALLGALKSLNARVAALES